MRSENSPPRHVDWVHLVKDGTMLNDTEILGLMFGILGGMVTAITGWAWYAPYRQFTPSSEKRNLMWVARFATLGTLLYHAMFLSLRSFDGSRIGELFPDVYLLSCCLGAMIGLAIVALEAHKKDHRTFRSMHAY